MKKTNKNDAEKIIDNILKKIDNGTITTQNINSFRKWYIDECKNNNKEKNKGE